MEISRALKLSTPLIISQLSFVLTLMLDTALMSQLGQDALAELAMSQTLWINFQLMGVGCLAAVDAYYSRALGQTDASKIRLTLFSSLIVALILAFFSVGLNFIFSSNTLLLYLSLNFFFLFPLVSIRQLLLAQGKIFWILFISISGPFLHYFLLTHLPLDKTSIGITHLIHRGVTLFILFWAVRDSWARPAGELARFSIKLIYQHSLEILKMGLPVGFQLLSRSLIFSILTYWVSIMGSRELAIQGVLMNIGNLLMVIPFSFASVTSIVVAKGFAQSLSQKAITHQVKQIFRAAFGLWLGVAVILYLFQDAFLRVWLHNEALSHEVKAFLIFPLVFVGFDSLETLFTGAFRGVLKTRIPFKLFVAAFSCLGLPLAYILGFYFHPTAAFSGLMGIWIALMTTSLLLGFWMLHAWRKTEG